MEFFQVIADVLVERIKKLIASKVSINKMALIGGRQIRDQVEIDNEVVEERMREKWQEFQIRSGESLSLGILEIPSIS